LDAYLVHHCERAGCNTPYLDYGFPYVLHYKVVPTSPKGLMYERQHFPVRALVSLQRRCTNNLNQVAIHANTYDVYPKKIAALQKDDAALWEPLSNLPEKLARWWPYQNKKQCLLPLILIVLFIARIIS